MILVPNRIHGVGGGRQIYIWLIGPPLKLNKRGKVGEGWKKTARGREDVQVEEAKND